MKIQKLQNRYTGEIVYCRDINKIIESTDYNFIRVFKLDNPEREYLVNRDAFTTIKEPHRDGNKAAPL